MAVDQTLCVRFNRELAELEAAGIPVADRPMDIVPALKEIWKR